MVTFSILIAPILTFTLAIIIGIAFGFAPTKFKQSKMIYMVAFSVAIGVVSLMLIFVFGSVLRDSVYSISLFNTFAASFRGFEMAIIKYNSEIVAATLLVVILEFGLFLGFSPVFVLRNKQEQQNPTAILDEQSKSKETPRKTNTPVNPSVPTSLNKPIMSSEEPGLRRNEQNMMELFLYGKVSQIIPTVNPTEPEGYSYEGIPQLDWDTKHSRQVLDALVRKGYLSAELIDKVIVCQTCGSGNVRVVKVCPECNSLRLHKEGLIEHFSCGAVERQSTFEGKNGDLICPKCHGKLQLIGSDYRILPPAFKCLSCNTLNSEPKLLVKCGDCISVADIDDEPEIMLYKYTLNPQMPTHELKRIKPIESVTKFFKGLGYTIVAPAFVSGRSGTQHLFDMLILGRVGWVETQDAGTVTLRNTNGNTAVEVLVAGKPINLGEITRIYGKISDIETDFLLFAVPGLTVNARNYAKAYGMKVSEGKSIDEALENSRIPKINGAETP